MTKLEESYLNIFPVSELKQRYKISHSAVYDRIRALEIKTMHCGKRAYIAEEQLQLMDDLHAHLQAGRRTAYFVQERVLKRKNTLPGDARNLIPKTGKIKSTKTNNKQRLKKVDEAGSELTAMELSETDEAQLALAESQKSDNKDLNDDGSYEPKSFLPPPVLEVQARESKIQILLLRLHRQAVILIKPRSPGLGFWLIVGATAIAVAIFQPSLLIFLALVATFAIATDEIIAKFARWQRDRQ